jgi:hypothetical protein
MSHWLGEVWIRIQDSFVLFFLLSLFHLENHVCLSHGVQVAGATWRAATRIVAGVGDLVQRTEDGRTGRVLGGRALERSGGTMCGLHRAPGDEEHRFRCWALKPKSTVCEWFSLKTTQTVFSSLASKLVATVCLSLALKPVVGFLVEPQNQDGGGFSGLGLKIGSFSLVIWASKSPRRFLGLGLKSNGASVCRLRHKTDGGRSACDTHRDLAACFLWRQVWLGFPSLAWRLVETQRRVVHVAPSWGCVGDKLKMDGSMRWAASDSATLPFPFSMY